MKRFLLLSLVGAILLNAVPALADDGFYVIAGRYTPGTMVTSLPYTITAPGYYYLTRNLTYNGGTGIIVDADNVTIDLMGFTLSGPSIQNSTFFGIHIEESRNNVEVRNGTVSGWEMGISGGVSATGKGNRVIGVRAVGNTIGVWLGGSGTGNLIEGCTAIPGNFGSGDGLGSSGGTITGCTVMNFNTRGIYIYGGGTVSNNVILNCTGYYGCGIMALGKTTISHNVVSNCTIGIDASRGGSITGNAVKANAGQTGIVPNDLATPTLLDQNSVNGEGTHYGPGGSATVMGLNSPQYIPQ